MKNTIKTIRSQMTAMLLTAVLAGSVAAGEELPFKGSLQGTFTVTPLDDPPRLLVLIEGGGHATQLGRFTIEIPHVVRLGTGTGIGTYDFTAANGDTLTADFTGVAAPSGTPGVLLIVETATIAGGTGRFAGATGSFTCVRLASFTDPTTGVTAGSFEGTIVLAKKN